MMNSIEKVWKEFLKECLEKGVWREKDDGDEILEIIDNHCFIPNVKGMLFGGGVNVNLDMFLDMIGSGVFNIDGYPMKDEALLGYVRQLDDPNQIFLKEGSFVYTYPERLFNMPHVNRSGDGGFYNQVGVITDRLRNYVGSNRGVATLYGVGLDLDEQHIPCLNWLQCLIRDDKLFLFVMFRSNDLWSAFPSNMLFLQYLGLSIVEDLKDDYPLLEFGGVYYNSSSLHVYKGDYEQMLKLFD